MPQPELDPWQKEVLAYDGDLLLCTGRRVGKTYILARKAIDLMARKPGIPIVIVSLTEDQAMIIMGMALNYAKSAYPSLIGKGRNKPTLRSLVLNGGKMIVRPVGQTGDAARGFEGGVLIVDEASRMPRMFWLAAKPILLTCNGQIWMGSTPFGKKGYFWEKYDEAVNKKHPNARFRVFSISTEEVMSSRQVCGSWTQEQKDGALRILAQDKREMSALEWMQEYMGLFMDSLLSFFSEEIIQKCCVLKRHPVQSGLRHYLGVDVGILGPDKSSFEIVCKISNDYLEQTENLTTQRTYVTDSIQKILSLMDLWPLRKVGIDNGGAGVGVFHPLLLEPKCWRKIIGLSNASKSLDKEGRKHTALLKEDMYVTMLALMEQGKLRLLDDDSVIASLRSIQQEIIDSDDDKSKVRISGRDSHICEGLIRSVWLAAQDKGHELWCR